MQRDQPYIRQRLICIKNYDLWMERVYHLITQREHFKPLTISRIYLSILDGLHLRGKGLSYVKLSCCYTFSHIPNTLNVFIQSWGLEKS